jgi:hypothetical protein
MLIGRQLAAAKAALAAPQIDPRYSNVAETIVRSGKISGSKGFTGKTKLDDRDAIAASVRSYDPNLSPKDVEHAADQITVKLHVEKARVELLMKVIVSVFCLAAGIYFLVRSSGNPDLTKWASGLIGTVVGYWLA